MLSSRGRWFVGLMSGTSLDGIDAAVVEISEQHTRLHHFDTFSLPDKLKEPIIRLNSPGFDEIDAMGMLDRALGHAFAEAANKVIAQAKLTPQAITAIGSHGQTLRHRPLGLHNSDPYTLQIGCASTIAERTGITVVSDFRSRDMAAGGQGAPLVPFAHQQLFAQTEQAVAVVNIGGIANISYLAAEHPVLGFDTGPGNMLMDQLMQSMSDARFAYDEDGALAATGQVNQALLDTLLAHDFFARMPPRSTGREDFGTAMVEQIMAVDITDADKMATACELSAQSIAQSMQFLPTVPDVWLICGGGAHNKHLLARLTALLQPQAVHITTDAGLDVDAVEAVSFALLASRTLQGKSNVIADVTGALHDVCGGSITPGKNWASLMSNA